MNRIIIYPGALPKSADILSSEKNTMIALAALAQATVGINASYSGTSVAGLACTQTTAPSMAVSVAGGSIYSLQDVDANAYGELAADTSDIILKCGVNIAPTVLSLTAPTISGQSINYLIEAAFSEADGTPLVLPYVNASNPSQPYSGPANAGTSQNTVRAQTVTIQSVAGTPATTGTQTTPAVTSGFVPLYVVTVAYGATSIVNSNISLYPGAPFVPSLQSSGSGRLLNVQVFPTAGTFTYSATSGTNSVIVEVVGGGGAGGSSAATSSSQVATAGGGAAGAYGQSRITSGFSGVTITVGAAGVPGATGANAGGNGGSSSFGSLITAPGGGGGSGATAAASQTAAGGACSIATGGNIVNAPGEPGGYATGVYAGNYISGSGGCSPYGAGGAGLPAAGAGQAARGYGSGGSGGCVGASSAAVAGGAGTGGIVVVREYS